MQTAHVGLHIDTENGRMQLSEADVESLRVQVLRQEARNSLESHADAFDSLEGEEWERFQKMLLEILGDDRLLDEFIKTLDDGISWSLAGLVLGKDENLLQWDYAPVEEELVTEAAQAVIRSYSKHSELFSAVISKLVQWASENGADPYGPDDDDSILCIEMPVVDGGLWLKAELYMGQSYDEVEAILSKMTVNETADYMRITYPLQDPSETASSFIEDFSIAMETIKEFKR